MNSSNMFDEFTEDHHVDLVMQNIESQRFSRQSCVKVHANVELEFCCRIFVMLHLFFKHEYLD